MSTLFDQMKDQLTYLLSLPERTLRSLAAVGSGMTGLLTESLFPETFRDTTSYKVFVGDAQRFVTEQIAQIHKEEQAGAPTDPNFVPRKMVGGVLEAAGLFAMHFSPLWVFALAGDAAAGSSVFLERLVGQLKARNILPPEANIQNVTDLLQAMQDASRRSAVAIDRPPLSREELSRLASQITDNYRQIFSRMTDLLPRFETLWQRINAVAARQNVSLERLVGILTVDAAAWGKKAVGTAAAVSQTGADLFGEKVLNSYARTLETISQEGVTSYMEAHLRPFFQAAAAHFDPKRKTWTESVLNRAAGAGTVSSPSPVNSEAEATAAAGEATSTPVNSDQS